MVRMNSKLTLPKHFETLDESCMDGPPVAETNAVDIKMPHVSSSVQQMSTGIVGIPLVLGSHGMFLVPLSDVLQSCSIHCTFLSTGFIMVHPTVPWPALLSHLSIPYHWGFPWDVSQSHGLHCYPICQSHPIVPLGL